MAAQKNEVSSADEILLTVPEDLVRVPLGFALDAGLYILQLLLLCEFCS